MYKITLHSYWTLPLLSLPPVTCTPSVCGTRSKWATLVLLRPLTATKSQKKKRINKTSTNHGTVFQLPPDIITPLSPLPGMPVPEGQGSLSVLHAVEDFPWLTFRCLSLHRMAPIGMHSVRLHARVTSWGGRFDCSRALAMRRVFAVESAVLLPTSGKDPGGRQTWGLKTRCFRKRSFDWTWHFPTRSAHQSLAPYLWLSSRRKPQASLYLLWRRHLLRRLLLFLPASRASSDKIGTV